MFRKKQNLLYWDYLIQIYDFYSRLLSNITRIYILLLISLNIAQHEALCQFFHLMLRKIRKCEQLFFYAA